MAINPMQRKAQNSFLLGVVITLLITGIIIAFLFLQLNKVRSERSKELKSQGKAYVLTRDIKSGEQITIDDFLSVDVNTSAIPENKISMDVITEKTKAKIDLKQGTIVTENMLFIDGIELTKDVRKVEFNMIQLPIDIATGDYVDIRLMLPTGQNFIVVAKKRIEIPEIAGLPSEITMSVDLTEEEIMTISNAIVDAYKLNGSYLYVSKYVEPGTQGVGDDLMVATYIPSQEVMAAVYNDPNIVREAREALERRYNATNSNRVPIQSEIDKLEDEAQSNLQSKTEEQMENSREERKNYLESME